MRRAARAERRVLRGGSWVGALILIVLGAMLLFANYTDFDLGRWWALLLLIPAVGAAVTAWNAYQAQQTGQAAAAVVGGLVSLGLALVFLFDLNVPWHNVWPLLLVAAGIVLLLRQAPSAS
jgi:uncharacterized membrane protein YhaH (DUF805 family)